MGVVQDMGKGGPGLSGQDLPQHTYGEEDIPQHTLWGRVSRRDVQHVASNISP